MTPSEIYNLLENLWLNSPPDNVDYSNIINTHYFIDVGGTKYSITLNLNGHFTLYDENLKILLETCTIRNNNRLDIDIAVPHDISFDDIDLHLTAIRLATSYR